MKPFDLEAALKGQKVILRDGRTATIAGYNPEATMSQQLLGWIGENYNVWYADGKSSPNNTEAVLDIIGMAPVEETRVIWIVPSLDVGCDYTWQEKGFLPTEAEKLAKNYAARLGTQAIRVEYKVMVD